MRNKRSFKSLLFLLVLTITGVSVIAASFVLAVSRSRSTPEIISFYAGTSDAVLGLIDYNIYDYFFVTDSGEITLRSSYASYDSAAAACHDKDVKFLLSLYSDEHYAGLYNVIRSPTARTELAENIRDMLVDHKYDGVNVDFEYTTNLVSIQSDVDAFITELHEKLHPFGKLIGYSSHWFAGLEGVSTGTEGWDFSLSVAEFVDLNNVMTYDMWRYTAPAGQPRNSSYQQTTEAMNRWIEAGYPEDRLYLGIPFYSERYDGSQAENYSVIIETLNPPPDTNTGFIDGYYRDWNGMDLVKQKASFAVDRGLAGVMVFAAPMDKLNDYRSLLHAAHDVFQSGTPLIEQPSVTTGVASNATATGATLHGSFAGSDAEAPVVLSFEYGVTGGYGSMTEGVPAGGNTNIAFETRLTGLSPETVYHYRAKAAGDGAIYGDDRTFKTAKRQYASWDPNRDESVNFFDLLMVAGRWGESGPAGWVREDVNADGLINELDLILIGKHWTG